MAKRKKSREDLSISNESFSSSPFAGLAELRSELPAGDEKQTPEPEKSESSPVPYSVQKTRKGGWALQIEKRGGGKIVTRLTGVSGDASALLKQLKKHCGSGGSLREDAIELQGDQRDAMRDFLNG